MKTIEASYRIVTPMFIGGANQEPSDGIRPPSFKGALRFWWRALHWGEFLQEENNNEEAALKALHQKEGELFGSAAKDGKGGQGCFLLKIEQAQNFQYDDKWPAAKPLGGSGYLGMGLWESGSKDKGNFQPHKKSIMSSSTFKVTLLLNQETSDEDGDEDKKQLCRTLKALGLLGGLGSRSRRGFGSLAIQSLNNTALTCDSTDKYQKMLKEVFSIIPAEIFPPFTAWSEQSRIGLLGQTSQDAKEAHKKASQLFYKVRGMKAEVRGTDKRGFGQPLPLKPMKKEYDQRRSSPLFFHVHPVGNQYVCAHLFMPAQFLPHEGFDMGFFNGVSDYMDKLNEVSL